MKILHEAHRDATHRAQRFVHERTILAGLEHPHIGRLLDAGETAEGRPYFVMERIDGEPIDRYCDRHHLPPAERVRLLLPVLAAVSHAHQHRPRGRAEGNLIALAAGASRPRPRSRGSLWTLSGLEATSLTWVNSSAGTSVK